MKKRVFSFDFIRAIAIVCIVLFHFGNEGYKIYPNGLIFHNYDLGSFGVSLFLILSGAALRYSDEGQFDIKKFIKGRFWAIYPMFWIAYFIGIIIYRVYLASDPFYGIAKWKYVFTLFAVDGWMSSFTTTFCVVGEWYLGCMLILYAVYPIIRFLIRKYPVYTLVSYFIIVMCVLYSYNMPIKQLYNPIIRVFEFMLGVAFSEYYVLRTNEEENKRKTVIATLISGILMMVLLYVPTVMNQMTNIQVGGVVAFFFLYSLGSLITSKKVRIVFETVSKYSFAIFLIHHVINNCLIHYYFSHYATSWKKTLLVFTVYIVVTGVLSFVLYQITVRIKKLRNLIEKKENR